MRLRRLAIPAVLLLCVMRPSAAHAEPVQITSGFLTSSRSGFATFEFVGADFFAAGFAEPGYLAPAVECSPCAPGDTFSMRAYYAGTIGSGTATVAGTSYDRINFDGELIFGSADVTTPSTPNGFTVSQPFTFSGLLLGIPQRGSGEEILFRPALTGHGTVTASFSGIESFPGGKPIFDLQTIRYEFGSDGAVPDPVPEPATLLLFGSGVGAALFRKGVRRRLE